MKAIETNKAPEALGPYSQGMEVDGYIFTSGQIPADPTTGDLKADIKEATKQSMENIKAILEEAGSSLDKVIKTTIYLTNMKAFGDVNEVYGTYFTDHKPARSCVEVLSLPKGSLIEIEAIAKK